VVEESAEELYEQAPCGYVSTLPDGTIVRVNHTFLEWTGATRDVLLAGTKFQALLTVGSRVYYETHYAPLLRMQ
jgi:PAS domain-containing protein